jgi:DNA-binding IclR family transcriptional regulator
VTTDRDVEAEVRFALGIEEQWRVDRGRPVDPHRTSTTGVGVLDRAASVIDAVEGGARSYTAIVGATGLPRTTAHRLIDALVAHGYLFHVGGLGYALGPRLLSLAATAIRELPLRQLARPALERLARTTNEGAQLYVRDGDRRVCVDSVESSRELRTIVEIGAALPIELGSAGTVLRVFDPLRAEHDGLRLVRERGWASSHEEREPGVASVSAPVHGPGGTLLAAVSVSGPSTRIKRLSAKEFAPPVLEAAREIEDALGVQS